MRLEQTTLTALALVAALAALTACDDDDDDRDAGVDAGEVRPDAAPAPTIAALAASRADLSVLNAAVARVGLDDELAAAGPLTLFAPTNEAFAASGITQADIDAMSDAELSRVLAYHVIQGARIRSTDVTSAPALTAADLTLFVSRADGVVSINRGNTVTGGANVVNADILASNGVIHLIDRVLLPPDIPTLATYGGLTSLVNAVQQAGLDDELAGPGPFTVLAPTNEAFAALPAVPAGDQLTTILLYHVISGELLLSDIAKLEPPLAVTSAENRFGNALPVVFDVAAARVNGASILLADLRATNGVVHVIDRVLIPPDVLAMAELLGLTSFVAAVDAAEGIDGTSLRDALSADEPYTVFAPTNEAFAAIEAALAVFSPAQVRDVLLFHVLDPTTFPAPVLAAQLPPGMSMLDTLLGEDASLDTTVTPPTIDGAQIIRTDVNVVNGVIHVIDAVMIPPTLE